MGRDPYVEPELLSGYTAETEVEPDSATGPAPTAGAATGADNRGATAPATGSGGAVGSGSGAGGGGSAEEHDDDAAGGGGAIRMPHPQAEPGEGGEGAKHGSR